MSTGKTEIIKDLGRFCEDEFEDTWENSESSGSTLDTSERYTNKQLIASGGMKEIFKVFDTKLDRDIALAQLIPDTDEELCEPFLREATLTASLEHPNIISVYDLGVNENHDPYFTMELKVGDTLNEIIDKGEKSLTELLEIFVKVCDAISYAHSQNIIHLDLKPDNIQVGKFGEVQVCDWGLSKKIDKIKTTEYVNGTPGYMAPEQSTPGKYLDKKTDIFSLGAVLYSILTCDTPVEGGVNTVLNTTVNHKILSPLERFPDKQIPASLDAVVRKAMARHREDRYESVEELKKEVINYLTGRSTEAENAGFAKELSLFIKRNRPVCIAAGVSIIAIIIGTLIFFAEIRESQKDTENALMELRKTHQDLIASKEQEKELYTQKEAALQMYIKANQDRREIYDQLVDQKLKQAYNLMVQPLYFSSPRECLDKSLVIFKSQLQSNSKLKGVKNLIVLNLFISQKFEEMKEYQSSKYEPLYKIAEKFSTKKRTQFGILNEPNFVLLLRDINALPKEHDAIKHDVIERAICYMVDVRQPIFTSVDVVRELIISWNPDWDSSNMSLNTENLTLRLFGKNLNKIIAYAHHSSGLCFLRFLKIDTLDIRGTGIQGLNQIDGLSINRLDIRNTPIQNLHPHGATKGIKEVYLTKGQFDADSEKHIPQSVKLIYK